MRRILAVAAVASALGLGCWWLLHQRRPDAWFRRLPGENVLLVHLDVAALRRSGSLTPLLRSQVPADPDYSAFVRDTGFAYQRDLDQAVLCLLPDRVYILARGRFDLSRLRAYAQSQGGACTAHCQMPASRPGRRISFLPLSSDLLALATAPEPEAVLALQNEPTVNALPLALAARSLNGGPALLWLTAAPSTLGQVLPIAPALSKAQRAYLFANSAASSGLQVVLHAQCASDAQAAETRRLLQGIHDLLGGLARRGPAEWSRVLNAALVEQQGNVARVSWVLTDEVLRSLSSPDRTTGRSPEADRPAGTGRD
jgi:hypothetical protein